MKEENKFADPTNPASCMLLVLQYIMVSNILHCCVVHLTNTEGGYPLAASGCGKGSFQAAQLAKHDSEAQGDESQSNATRHRGRSKRGVQACISIRQHLRGACCGVCAWLQGMVEIYVFHMICVFLIVVFLSLCLERSSPTSPT